MGLWACYGGMYGPCWGKGIHSLWGTIQGPMYRGYVIVASVFRWVWRDQSGWGLFRRVLGTFKDCIVKVVLGASLGVCQGPCLASNWGLLWGLCVIRLKINDLFYLV